MKCLETHRIHRRRSDAHRRKRNPLVPIAQRRRIAVLREVAEVWASTGTMREFGEWLAKQIKGRGAGF